MNDPNVIRTPAAEIRRDAEALKMLHEDALEVLERFRTNAPGRLELRIPAGVIHDYYTGIETTFIRIVEIINGSYPGGSESHHRLLEPMTLDVDGLRPAVISEEARQALDELRKFRHFFRHAYTTQLRWEHVRPLLERIIGKHEIFAGELEAFAHHLLRLAGDLEQELI